LVRYGTNRFRKAMNLRRDQIQFKAERKVSQKFGVSPNGRSFTNAHGDTGRVEYANRFNHLKGSRLKVTKIISEIITIFIDSTKSFSTSICAPWIVFEYGFIADQRILIV